jgi:hypothetical protein
VEISTFNNVSINQYSRSDIKTKLDISLNSILGEFVDVSYINKDSFLFAKGIERITNIPISHLHARPTNSKGNEGVRLRLERYGN